MSVTKWEVHKGLSDRLRAIWDAKRGESGTWEDVYVAAREVLAQVLERDAGIVREMSWDEFRRLQGWHEPARGIDDDMVRQGWITSDEREA